FRVNGRYRPVLVTSMAGSGVARLAVDGTRIAVAWPDGTAIVAGRRLDIGKVGAIALEGNELVALAGNRVDVYSVSTGKRIHSWPVPLTARGLDLQDGIAAFSNGHTAVVLDTRNGRTAVVGRGAAPLAGVQIEGPGLAYAWSSGSKGVARFVTTRSVDVALG